MKETIKTKEKGFTLIELLAVIVVLAILALIAVPIVLNIIKDARNNSNKRSIESYARAIDYAVSEYMAENPDQEIVTWEDVKDKVEYKGKVECQWGENLSSISTTGEITLHGCKVNNKTNSIYGYVDRKVVEENEIVYSAYNVGDCEAEGTYVNYNGEKYCVIAPSDTKQDYVTLLKAEPLTVDEVNKYGGVGTSNNHVNMYATYDTSDSYYQTALNHSNSGYGGMAYYSSPTCGYPTAGSSSGYTTTGCTTDYKKSEIKYVVDEWSKEKFKPNYLSKDSTGYEARLLSINDCILNLGFTFPVEYDWISLKSSLQNISWLYFYHFDLMDGFIYSDVDVFVWEIQPSGLDNMNNVLNPHTVRPVINLKKSAIK